MGLTHTRSPSRAATSRSQTPVVLVAADEAEVVLPEAEHGRVVDHPAGLVAQRRVHDLADRQLARRCG